VLLVEGGEDGEDGRVPAEALELKLQDGVSHVLAVDEELIEVD